MLRRCSKGVDSVLSLFCHTGTKPWKLFITALKLRKPCCKEGSANTASPGARRQEHTAGWMMRRKLLSIFFHPVPWSHHLWWENGSVPVCRSCSSFFEVVCAVLFVPLLGCVNPGDCTLTIR